MGRLARITVPSVIPTPPADAPPPSPRFYAEGPQRDATPEHVQTELTRLAFGNVADIISIDEDGVPTVDLSSASREALAPIQSITSTRRSIYNAKGDYLGEETTVRIGLADKLKALELQGRYLGMFKPQELHVVHDLADRLLKARQRWLEEQSDVLREPTRGLPDHTQ